MQRSKETFLVAGLLALVLGAWAVLTFGSGDPRGGRSNRQVEHAVEPGQTASGPAVNHLVDPQVVVPRAAESGDVYTTVLWPIEVELELIETRHRPKAEGLPTAGSGSDAKVKGRVTDRKGTPVGGVRVTFLEGANAGRILRGNANGEFGATNLYPGLSIVEVRGDGIFGAKRELRLRSRKETLLNLSFGRPAAVLGQVFDHAGQPLEGAEVNFDGTKVWSGTQGDFYLPQVCGGPCLVEVRADGHAHHREVVHVTSGKVLQRDRCKFRLQKACELTVIAKDDIGGPGPISLTLMPVSERSNGKFPARTYPWYDVSPVELTPGRALRIDGLPRGGVRLLGFRRGAKVKERVVNLRPERSSTVELSLEKAPVIEARVLNDGMPQAGALVRIEAPDRVRASLALHRRPSYFLETSVQPFLAPTIQESTSDAEGKVRFTAYDEIVPVSYLEAWGPGNTTWAGRVVRRGEYQFDLELGEIDFGNATLVLEMAGRHMGLPVEVTVNGRPHSELILPAGEPLEIDSLVEGTWKLKVSWQAQPLLPERLIDLEESVSENVLLGPEQIEGQSAEQWSRAGRVWPGEPH